MDDSSSVGPRTNIVLSLGILAFCGLGWVATNTLPSGLRVDPLGPAYYPRFVLLGTAALAAALLVASIRDLHREARAGRAESIATDPAPFSTISAQVDATGHAVVADAEVAGDGDGDEEELPPVSYPRMLAVLALSIGYALVMTTLGYVISTALFVAILLVVLRVRNWLIITAWAIGTPLVLGSLFGWLLGIPLPGGPLEGVLPF